MKLEHLLDVVGNVVDSFITLKGGYYNDEVELDDNLVLQCIDGTLALVEIDEEDYEIILSKRYITTRECLKLLVEFWTSPGDIEYVEGDVSLYADSPMVLMEEDEIKAKNMEEIQ